MQLIKDNYIKKIIKYFYKFIVKIFLFESIVVNKQKIRIKSKIHIVNTQKEAKKNIFLKSYFKSNIEKYDRFKGSKFVFLKKNNDLIASGWICSEKIATWNIEEIDKKINIKNKKILYDFETNKKYRNKGYYALILKLIQNKYLKDNLLIYTQANNYPAVKAITNAGFKFKYSLKKI